MIAADIIITGRNWRRAKRERRKLEQRRKRAPLELRWRKGDTCPACSSPDVFAGVELQEHAGEVFIDGCGRCGALWQRETRAAPTKEACTNCAWRAGSPEVKSGKIFTIMQRTLWGKGIFYCHRRVPFRIKDGTNTEFEHKANDAGTRITNATVCAGWLRAKIRERKFERNNAEPIEETT